MLEFFAWAAFLLLWPIARAVLDHFAQRRHPSPSETPLMYMPSIADEAEAWLRSQKPAS